MNTQPTKRFLANYYHDGAWWTLNIYAYDFDDAEVRCKKLNAQLLGELKMSIPAVTGSWLAKAICWLRNLKGE